MQHTRKRARLLKSALLGAATLGALSLAGAGVAQADTITLWYSTNGGTSLTQITTSPTSAAPLTAGNFSVTGFSATGNPPLNSGTFFTNTIDVSTTGSTASPTTLDLYAVDNGITPPPVAVTVPLQVGFTSNTIQNFNTGDQVLEKAFLDTSNTTPTSTYGSHVAALSPIDTKLWNSAVGGSVFPIIQTGLPNTSYALITMFSITAVNSGYGTNNAINISKQRSGANVPEPGSLALLGTGLLGLAVVVRRRRRKA